MWPVLLAPLRPSRPKKLSTVCSGCSTPAQAADPGCLLLGWRPRLATSATTGGGDRDTDDPAGEQAVGRAVGRGAERGQPGRVRGDECGDQGGEGGREDQRAPTHEECARPAAQGLRAQREDA